MNLLVFISELIVSTTSPKDIKIMILDAIDILWIFVPSMFSKKSLKIR